MGCGGATSRCNTDTSYSPFNSRREARRFKQKKGNDKKVSSDIVKSVEERREIEVPEVRAVNAVTGGEAIYSDEIEKRLGGGSGYKLLKEIPTCHGKYFEAYELDSETGEYIIAVLTARREEGKGPSLKPRG